MALRDVVLSLGPVQFASFEIPETIDFGGRQRIAVHDLPGGTRVVDLMGPVPADISWSGIFSGPDATGRARLLDRMRAQGQVLALSWDVYSYSVVIRQLSVQYHNSAWAPYRITITVLQDNSVAIPPTPVQLITEALADVASAANFGGMAGLNVTGLQAALATPGATTLGTAAYLNAEQNLAGVQASAGTDFTAADTLVAAYATNGVESPAALTALASAASDQAALNWAGQYLARLGTNLGRAGT